MGESQVRNLEVAHAVQAVLHEKTQQSAAEPYSPKTKERILRKKTKILGESGSEAEDESADAGFATESGAKAGGSTEVVEKVGDVTEQSVSKSADAATELGGEAGGKAAEVVEQKDGDLSGGPAEVEMAECAESQEGHEPQVNCVEMELATQREVEDAADEAEQRAVEDAKSHGNEAELDPPEGFHEVPNVYRSQQQGFKSELDAGEDGKGKKRPGRKPKGAAKKKAKTSKEPEARALAGEIEELAEPGEGPESPAEKAVPKAKAKVKGKACKANPSPQPSMPESPKFARGKAKAKAKASAAKEQPKAKARSSKKDEAAAGAVEQEPKPQRKARKSKQDEAEAGEKRGGSEIDGMMNHRASFAGRYPPKTAQALSRFQALVAAFEEKIQFKVDSPSLVEDGTFN